MLVTERCQLLRTSGGDRVIEMAPKSRRCRSTDLPILTSGWGTSPPSPLPVTAAELRCREPQPACAANPQEIDPLYLFACYVEWEQREEPGAAWELLAAAQGSLSDSRAHARALLSDSHHLGGISAVAAPPPVTLRRTFGMSSASGVRFPPAASVLL